MRNWGYGFLSLGALLIAFHNWIYGFFFVILSIIMIIFGGRRAKAEKLAKESNTDAVKDVTDMEEDEK
jgi:hypothetical protein